MFVSAKSTKAEPAKKGGKAAGKGADSAKEAKKSWTDGLTLPYLLGASSPHARCRPRHAHRAASAHARAVRRQHGRRRDGGRVRRDCAVPD